MRKRPPKNIKVGFDARMIDHPGIGRYIRSLLAAMPAVAEDYEFVLYGDSGKLTDFKHYRKEEYTMPIYSWSEFFFTPFKKDEFDVVHIPHFNVPLMIGRGKGKVVITVHDLIYLKFPESATLFKRIAARFVISNAIKAADKVLAVSENTKRDIIENFPDAEGKVEVTYEAADPIFKRVEGEDKKESIRKKYDLPQDIILFVGSLKRHKNIERLIDAYINLKSKGIQHKLVIAGRYRQREEEILKKIKSTDALYLGEVPTEDLVLIYNLASLLAIPSLYEGFGLPALEAMACGVPVVASSAASLPEIVGDAGVLFNPQDTKDISNKLYQVLSSERLRQELIGKGLKRASLFSWEKTARQTLEVYKEVIRIK